MATIVCLSVETSASSRLQKSSLRPCEPTSSSLAALSPWKSKSLRSGGHSKVASERSRSFYLATRAAVVADRDVESVSTEACNPLFGPIFEMLANCVCFAIPFL